MKRSVATLGVLLACVTPLQAENMVGLYADQYAQTCHADFAPFATTTVYVIATLGDISGITSAEFRVHGLPPTSSVIRTENWSSLLTIGNLEDDFAIAFSEPLIGSTALIGSLDFFPVGGDSPGTDQLFTVKGGLMIGSEGPLLVGLDNETIEVLGGRFTANCSSDAGCPCGAGGYAQTHWSAVKQIY